MIRPNHSQMENQENINQKLYNASRNGKLDEVKQLLSKGANVNWRDTDDWTPLHWAACRGHSEVVSFLISCGADVNAKSNDLNTPLHYAARWGKEEVVAYLLQQGADANVINKSGQMASDEAKETGAFRIKLLIGILFFLILQIGDVDVVWKEIKQLGLQKHFEDPSDSSRISRLASLEKRKLLHALVSFKSVKTFSHLIDQGIFDLNDQDEDDGNTALHLVCKKGNVSTTQKLLSVGADISIKNKEGKTCKDVANEECKELFEDIKQLKVVIVGKYEVGKTTLVKGILHKSIIKKTFNSLSKNERTDGIEMHQWIAGDKTVVQLWDFGGQQLFYTTHQFFISNESIVLLVFKLSEKIIEPELSFWLNSILCRAPKSKVVVVGTFFDEIDEKLVELEFELISQKVKEIYDKVIAYAQKGSNQENLLELIPCNSWDNPTKKEKDKYTGKPLWFWPISAIKGWNVERLEQQIKLLCLHKIVRAEVMKIATELTTLKEQKIFEQSYPILSVKETETIIFKYVPDEQNLSSILNQLHELGFVLFFQGLDYVILDPQWLSTVFRSIVSLRNSIDDGMITRDQILANISNLISGRRKSLTLDSINISSEKFWSERRRKTEIQQKKNKPEDHEIFSEFLIQLLEKFQICFPKPHDEIKVSLIESSELETSDEWKVVPCLLERKTLEKAKAMLLDENEVTERKYFLPFIPRGVFETLCSQIASFLGSKMKFWGNGFIISLKMKKESQDILFRLVFQISEKKSTIGIWFWGESWDFVIPAIHFSVKELFEKQFPLIWAKTRIEISYYNRDQNIYFPSTDLNTCIEKHKSNSPIQTPDGKTIPWNKLIPEQLEDTLNDQNNEIGIMNSSLLVPTKFIGEGGQAWIFECKSLTRTGVFVVKQFLMSRKIPGQKEKLEKAFERELKACQALREHPNIVKLIGFDKKGDNWILVFPLYDKSLNDIRNYFNRQISEKNFKMWWNVSEIKAISQMVLDALHFMHSKSFVHLDLKAENVLVKLSTALNFNENQISVSEIPTVESVYLHDFGTSYEVKPHEQVNYCVGSFSHMAPEVRLCLKSDITLYDPFKADIFSFGVLLIELNTHLFKSNSAVHSKSVELRNQVLKLRLDELKEIDNPFSSIISSCLEMDPDKRPSTTQLLTLYAQI